MPLYVPEKLPEDGSNLQVCAALSFVYERDMATGRARH